MNTRLAEFLAADARSEETLIYPELYGFLFTVCSSPELLKPSDWLPVIFGGEAPAFADDEEHEAIMADILAAHDEINDQMNAGKAKLPEWCEILEPPMENFGDEALLAHWSRGFARGQDWLEEVWEAYTPEDMKEELGPCLATLSFFADRDQAESFCEGSEGDEPLTVEEMAEAVVDNIERAMASYSRMGRHLHQLLFEQQPVVREEPKVGRNDPCPCGSGKKYKKCCLQ